MRTVVKKETLDGDGEPIFDGIDGVYDYIGKIRLWEEGTPPVPTDKYILIGDFPPNTGEKIKGNHVVLLTKKRDDVFTASKVSLIDYSVANRRSFNMDIRIPQSILDQYTG